MSLFPALLRKNSRGVQYFHNATLLALAIVASAAFYCDPSSAADQDRIRAGQLLVATDEIADARFAETVVYIVKHNAEGTLGLIINRPVAKGTLDDLLKGFGVTAKNPRGEIVIHYGGPVSQRQGFLLHSDDVLLDSSTRVDNGIAMTSDVKMIEAIAAGRGPRQYLFTLGYTGWAPGQLEAEIAANAWFTIPGEKSLIFGKEAEQKWRQATDKRRIPL
ncbi:MAG TPA: YqgE/AlgH family protein [Terriglobales bacterium]|jgi:putative transcriptional regulator|nr:YqgE/AlgH family protein [Terriglobales bacterium]